MNVPSQQHPAEQDSPEIREHNAGQRDYYARRKPVRMDVTDSAYVRLHFNHALAASGLQRGETVLEVGAGMGRFTRRFAAGGNEVTAVELSPALAADCRQHLAPWPAAKVLTADLLDAPELLRQQFDVVAGFFMLHHLTCLDRHLAAINALLKPGGRCVFVEPNPWNPLYAVQITCTPGMRWSEEVGIYNLGQGNLRRLATAAGLADLKVERYGCLPRWLHNQLDRSGVNPWLEKLTPRGLRPFQLITARRPNPDE